MEQLVTAPSVNVGMLVRRGNEQARLSRCGVAARGVTPGLREAVGAEQEADDERVHRLGRLPMYGGGDQGPAGRHPAAHGRTGLAHRGRGLVTKPEEKKRARPAARPDHHAGEIAGVVARLATGDHFGRRGAEVRVDPG